MNFTNRSTPSKSKLCTAVSAALLAGTFVGQVAVAQEQEQAQADDQEVIEEVVATGTRLKGTAAAVMQERQNQAFVADIMGAEQISRTGDGDAASALRRVTGLTLVDGKFSPLNLLRFFYALLLNTFAPLHPCAHEWKT